MYGNNGMHHHQQQHHHGNGVVTYASSGGVNYDGGYSGMHGASTAMSSPYQPYAHHAHNPSPNILYVQREDDRNGDDDSDDESDQEYAPISIDSSRELDASAREGRGHLHEERRPAESATMMAMPPSDRTIL